jgi:hypothetical protein
MTASAAVPLVVGVAILIMAGTAESAVVLNDDCD